MAYNKITLNGETKIDLTQDTVTAEDVVAGKTFHLNSGESAVGTLEVSSGGGGGGAFFDRTFANNTPAQIAQVSALISYNNMTSEQVASTYGWNVGDTISYQLTTGENVEMRIIGFNHDDKSDGSGKAGITLDMTHRLETQYPMNSTQTNQGGYPASTMKKTTLPAIKETLPQDWQDVIKTVNKKAANGGGTFFTSILTIPQELFLLSLVEVGASDGSTAIYQEGSLYEYWVDKDKSYRGKGGYYFTRSCDNTGKSSYRAITSSGNADWSSANSADGVSFAFCI